MTHATHRATVLLGAVAAATALATAAPAQSTTLAPSRIVVHVDDSTPASGQPFHLSGAVWSQGERVPATVRVKTFRNGQWHQLPGAVHETNRDNRYHLHVTLQMKGERLLKVIGDPRDPDIRTAVATVTVTVH